MAYLAYLVNDYLKVAEAFVNFVVLLNEKKMNDYVSHKNKILLVSRSYDDIQALFNEISLYTRTA